MEKWTIKPEHEADLGQLLVQDNAGNVIASVFGPSAEYAAKVAAKVVAAPTLAQACRLAMVELAKTEECEAYTALRAALTAYDGRT